MLAPLLILLVGVAACSDPDQVAAEDHQAIEHLLEDYLPRLSQAYRTGNLEVLRGVAAEKEIASLFRRIGELANSEGRTVVPTLQSFEVEEVTIWNHSNAFVTTLEVWDLQVLATGSEKLLSEAIGQRNRVRYQLKRRDQGWQVLYRGIEATFETGG